MENRASGVLCHITSLPGPFGIGDLGPSAYAFADFLAETKQSYWQVLPLNPTNPGTGNSPYNSLSAFAGNPLLISPELLRTDGLIDESDSDLFSIGREGSVDYAKVTAEKHQLLRKAFNSFRYTRDQQGDFLRFCAEEAGWLEEFSLYSAVQEKFEGKPIWQWPSEARNRGGSEFDHLRKELAEEIETVKFQQYLFARQWHALKNYCNGKGILIIGDLPFFMDYNSAEIWIRPELFQVDHATLKAVKVAGAPPDSFAEQGQLFGCAAYDWDNMKQQNFSWWTARLKHMLRLYDILRIDHFRGFVACWEVPAGEETALAGAWHQVPFYELMNALLKQLPTLPVFAEDLGLITPDVREAMRKYRIPGIKMLLFGFAKEMRETEFLLHNHVEDSVVFTGTHDTNTIVGWFEKNDNQEDKELLFKYLGRQINEEVNWEMVRMAMMSVAKTAIIPIQDLLGLGQEGRMNEPGKSGGNWQWRLLPGQITDQLKKRWTEMTTLYGRA